MRVAPFRLHVVRAHLRGRAGDPLRGGPKHACVFAEKSLAIPSARGRSSVSLVSFADVDTVVGSPLHVGDLF